MNPGPVSVLAIHAHPDDVEIQCAGTLALLKENGCRITIATMTAGDCGSAEYSASEIAAIRRKEAKAAADMLGADYMCLEFQDLRIFYCDEAKGRVTEALRRARADVVLTAPLVDYMADHEVTGRLVRDACFAASVPNYTTRQWDPAPILKKIPHLYFVDAVGGSDYYGRPLPPQFIVDVTKTYPLKRDMLACHASQRNWLRQQHGMDEYLEACDRWSARRGTEIGVRHGEGFVQYVGHPYPEDNLLLKLLGK
jgi:LmbE family N-acetylglucosaminyl deacetylase